jgi:hypothetical protein
MKATKNTRKGASQQQWAKVYSKGDYQIAYDQNNMCAILDEDGNEIVPLGWGEVDEAGLLADIWAEYSYRKTNG